MRHLSFSGPEGMTAVKALSGHKERFFLEMVSPYSAFNRPELALTRESRFLSIFQKVLALNQTTGIEREVGKGKEGLSITGITRTVELVTAYDNNENDKKGERMSNGPRI